MAIPPLGLGTWKQSPEICRENVETALELGYRHIDTAQIYGTETAVGEAIDRSPVPREDVFVATKIWIENLSKEDVVNSVTESLNDLSLDTIDLVYVHWPSGKYDPEDTFGGLNELYERDRIGSVGLSNFTPTHIDTALDHSAAPVEAVQCEMHPYLRQESLRSYCQRRGLAFVAYCPLAHGKVFDMPEISSVAEEEGVSEAVVTLSWLISKPGVHPVTKATGERHLRENLEALDHSLSSAQLDRIDGIDRRARLLDPDHAPNWHVPDGQFP